MTFDKLATALRQQKFHIDAGQMALLQNVAENPVAYIGKGYVEQDSDGVLQFKIYPTEIQNIDAFRHLQTFSSTAAGTIYGDDQYYALTLTGHDGTVWSADRIIPRTNWSAKGEAIVTGTLNRLMHESATQAPGGHGMRLAFFDDVERVELPLLPALGGDPANSGAKFSAAGCDIHVQAFDGEVVIEAESPDPISEHTPLRFHEALKFVTMKPMAMRVISRTRPGLFSIEYLSAPAASPRTRLHPPIGRGTSGYYEHTWLLFSRYLEFVARTPHSYWHHCTYHLHNATEASANSIDAWAVGVSVAVEGLASLVLVEIPPAEKARLAQLRSWILKNVGKQKRFAPYPTRLGGLLGLMANVRVQDRLLPLAETGHITEQYLKAWSGLRNRHVHPKVKDLRKIASGEYQVLFDLINQTTSLMYQIVFFLIGYEGPYADYGARGFPTRHYPAPPVSAGVTDADE